MSEYFKLKEEFDRKVEELRRVCQHEALTEPQEVYWAYGHSSGYSSRYCKRCGKKMDSNPWRKEIKIESVRDKRK